tara:strand:+ start:4100 stop:4753 length:654 start_codon:yes stop_codon:yes gene_type:complete
MKEIEHEGKTYILKTDVENIIKERVSKVATRANTAESRIAELEQTIEKNRKSLTSVDLLNTQLTELKDKLALSETRFSRYQSISKHGLTDPDLVDAIEWQYDRAQSKLAKKDRVSLGDWLDGHVSNPESAPVMLRPHLTSIKPPAASTPESAAETPSAPSAPSTPSTPSEPPPKTNSGAMPAPELGNFMDRALKDPEVYRQNRDKIMSAWKNRRSRG